MTAWSWLSWFATKSAIPRKVLWIRAQLLVLFWAPQWNGNNTGLHKVEPGKEVCNLRGAAEGKRRNRNMVKLVKHLKTGGEILIVTMVRDRQIATRAQRIDVGRDEDEWIVGIGDEMQHVEQEHGDGRIQVEAPTPLGCMKNLIRPTQIRAHHSGVIVAGQQRSTHRHDIRSYVHIDHAAPGIEALRDLVHVACRGKARAQVEELSHARTDQMAHHPAQQRSVHAHHVRQLRSTHQDALGDLGVGDRVVRSA